VGNILTRNQGHRWSRSQIEALKGEQLAELFADRERTLTVESSLKVLGVLDHQIAAIEKQIKSRLRQDPSYRLLETVYGIGEILAMTIRLETGDVGRFPQVGNYVSYCRCVGSQRLSNDKKKGENNRHNGNKYLAWAYVEAAYGAARFYPQVRSYVEKKTAQSNHALALKALAHKLARACYYVMRDQVPFEPSRLFGS
jgi:transposase